MKREDFVAMIPENDKYVGSNIYLNGKNAGFEECLQMIKDSISVLPDTGKYFVDLTREEKDEYKNKNAKDGTCQKWKARCGGQRVNSEDFCSDFEKKIDKD